MPQQRKLAVVAFGGNALIRKGQEGTQWEQLENAQETARALISWARTTFGIRRFISSTTPRNAASLRVHDKLGFTRTGEIVDGEIIFELRV